MAYLLIALIVLVAAGCAVKWRRRGAHALFFGCLLGAAAVVLVVAYPGDASTASSASVARTWSFGIWLAAPGAVLGFLAMAIAANRRSRRAPDEDSQHVGGDVAVGVAAWVAGAVLRSMLIITLGLLSLAMMAP